MIRHIRHFATRLRRGGSAAPITATHGRIAQSAAWIRFDQWLRHEPLNDIVALRERELIHEHARVAVALVGQAGAAVVTRIGSARNTDSLQNEEAARFTLEFACARGSTATRAAACAALTARSC